MPSAAPTTPTATAPTAPAAPAATPPASTGSVAPPSGGEIKVPGTPTPGTPAAAPPKPGSARDRMAKELHKFAGVTEPGQPDPKTPPPTTTEPNTPPPADPPAGDPPPADPPAEPGKPPTTTEPIDKKKTNPWKLLDEYKGRESKLQAEILELKKQILPEAQRKESEERLTKAEQRAKEMQEDLRFYNAEKYDPDVLKANAAYEGAWKNALAELSELTVTDAQTNQQRPVQSQDILALVNMPLGQAREIAEQVFGNFADDVMAHRKEIKQLFDRKMATLDELKKTGADREKKRLEAFKKSQGEINTQVQSFWDKEVADVQAHATNGKFFKPREGDDEWNGKLEKGFKLVDDAYARNVSDPGLTPQERQAIVRRHVAVRNRAAAFESLRLDYSRLEAKLAAAEKELAGYKGSTPGTGGTVTPGTAPAKLSARDELSQGLRKLAGVA